MVPRLNLEPSLLQAEAVRKAAAALAEEQSSQGAKQQAAPAQPQGRWMKSLLDPSAGIEGKTDEAKAEEGPGQHGGAL